MTPNTKPKPKARPRPTQDECLEWLRNSYPELYIKAARERDWIWIRGSRGDALFSGKTDALKSFGFRLKQEGVHRLNDGTDAVWYHSCQGKWRPTYKRYGGRRYQARKEEDSMSKSDALKFAKSLQL